MRTAAALALGAIVLLPLTGCGTSAHSSSSMPQVLFGQDRTGLVTAVKNSTFHSGPNLQNPPGTFCWFTRLRKPARTPQLLLQIADVDAGTVVLRRHVPLTNPSSRAAGGCMSWNTLDGAGAGFGHFRLTLFRNNAEVASGTYRVT